MGQLLVEPLQVSAWSQSPFFTRHTVEVEATASEGQLAPAPEQFSATSQTPLAARQTVEEGR